MVPSSPISSPSARGCVRRRSPGTRARKPGGPAARRPGAARSGCDASPPRRGASGNSSPRLDALLQARRFYAAYTPYHRSEPGHAAAIRFQTGCEALRPRSGEREHVRRLGDGEAVLCAAGAAKRPASSWRARFTPTTGRARTTCRSRRRGARRGAVGDDGRVDLGGLGTRVDAATAVVVLATRTYSAVAEDLESVRSTLGNRARPRHRDENSSPWLCCALRVVGSTSRRRGAEHRHPALVRGTGVGLVATRTRHVRSMPGAWSARADGAAARLRPPAGDARAAHPARTRLENLQNRAHGWRDVYIDARQVGLRRWR